MKRFVAALVGAAGMISALSVASPVERETPAASGETTAKSANGSPRIQLNFRNAPLELVLDYLSEAAGFIIVKPADVKGSVDVWSKEPVTPDEAYDLLSMVLRRNGYAVTRNKRVLTILGSDEAKTADLEIEVGAEPTGSKSDEVITQVIPVRHANASQMQNNLQVLLPTTTSLTVNESANSLVLVATRRDISRILKIVKALDGAVSAESAVKVFQIKHADAKQLAAALQQLFGAGTTQNGNAPGPQGFFGPGGFGGFPGVPGQFGGPGVPGGGGPDGVGGGRLIGAVAGQAGAGQSGNAARTKAVAVAEETSNTLIVSASPDLMPTVVEIVNKLDIAVNDTLEVRLFKLAHADPSELADQLAVVFPDESRNGTGAGGGFSFRQFQGPQGGGGANSAAPSERQRKQTKVVAVADARTSSLLISAASALMPQIQKMISELDSSSARTEVVKVYNIDNANPARVKQVLQDLFNRNTTAMRNNDTRNETSEQGNALLQRETQQQQNNQNNNNGFGAGGTPGGGGSGFGGGGGP